MASTGLKTTSAVSITEYPLPAPNIAPGPMVVVGQQMLFAATATCTTSCDNTGVFSVDTAGKVSRVEDVCSGKGPSCRAGALVSLPAGGYCFNTGGITAGSIDQSDRITCVLGSTRSTQSIRSVDSSLGALAVGHDGKVWFTDMLLNALGRRSVDGTTAIEMVYRLGPALGFTGITQGPAGTMWVTALYGNKIGRITSTDLTLFDIPTADSQPLDIVQGPDGNLWFTEFKGNKIGRITPSGTITEFPLPTAGAGPVAIVVGPDNALWFTEGQANKIGRITTSGTVTEYPVPTADSGPADIVTGPDGNLWFTQNTGNKVAKITVEVLPQVVEFYNTNSDHYFITANAAEQTAIDGGSAGPGWSRTGATFASGGATAVCRFYGSISPGPNSHFYTADANECAALKQLQATTPATQKRWNFESNDFLTTPASNGMCPAGLVPIYRAYNNGFTRGIDSNHRITPSSAAIAAVVARGWSSEGVVMCAPQ